MSRSRILHALADPTRRRVLELLRDDDLTAGSLGSHFDLAASTMSRHFQVLRDAGLVRSEKRGTSITYSLNLSVLEEALMSLMNTFGIDGPAGAGPATNRATEIETGTRR